VAILYVLIDETGLSTVMLFDLLGRKLRELRVNGEGRVHGLLDVSALQTGMYLLIVHNRDATSMGKVVIAR